MIIPTDESLKLVIQEILDKDYTTHPESPINGELEYPEETVPLDMVPLESVDKVLTSNYVEPNKVLQSAYESQFRAFSSASKKSADSFEALL